MSCNTIFDNTLVIVVYTETSFVFSGVDVKTSDKQMYSIKLSIKPYNINYIHKQKNFIIYLHVNQ